MDKKKEKKNIESDLKALRLRPVELVSKAKEEKKQKDEPREAKKEDKSKEAEPEPQRTSQFSERILNEESPKKFTAPVLIADSQSEPGPIDNLEQFAEKAPAQTPAGRTKETGYTSSKSSYAGRQSTYTDYSRSFTDDKIDYEATARPAPVLGAIRSPASARTFESQDFRRLEQPTRGMERIENSPEKRAAEEFSREQQYKVQRIREEKPRRRG